MRPRTSWLVALSTITSFVAALVVYASKVSAADWPQWLSEWFISHRPLLALGLLCLSILGTLVEAVRWYIEKRHGAKGALQRLLDAFANSEFKGRAKKNRLTLFKTTSGFRVFSYGLIRLPLLDQVHKWRALKRLRPRWKYLGVYLRASEARNRKSTTALRVSDSADHCEGMAGLVWEEGACMLANLPRISAARVRDVAKFDSLEASDPIRIYAESTNIRDLVLLQSMEHYARHFMGYLIRRQDGTPWGVLLLDSEEDVCPFPTDAAGGVFGQKLAMLAQVFGILIT
jgi:hypothetical protein